MRINLRIKKINFKKILKKLFNKISVAYMLIVVLLALSIYQQVLLNKLKEIQYVNYDIDELKKSIETLDSNVKTLDDEIRYRVNDLEVEVKTLQDKQEEQKNDISKLRSVAHTHLYY